ncbi:MAG: DNA primase large subunit PriL [Candidatus Thermoplasmatota archaeon]
MTDLLLLAKYPFLNETRRYVKEHGPSIQDLIENQLYERARILAVERLENAIKKKDTSIGSLVTETDCLMTILSYPLARMISVCTRDTYLQKRYALGEAYTAYKHLLSEPLDLVLDIAEELKIKVYTDEEDKQVSVYFKDYLRYSPTRYKEWKLVNRTMKKGYVLISQRELCRMILEALRIRINQELTSRECDPLVSEIFHDDIQRLLNLVKTDKKRQESIPLGKLNTEKLPPCIKTIYYDIKNGENVPHMGRFALVSFLHSLKLTSNDIIKIFNTAPDYEEDKARYQIEHITGASSSTSYKSPGCDKMRTYGLCPSDKVDEICKTIHHPLTYYQQRWRQEKDKK